MEIEEISFEEFSKNKQILKSPSQTKLKGKISLSFTTPTKITRSGRRIVPPNKDMPEPMTPPNRSTEKKINSENSLLSPKSTDSTPNSNTMQIKITDMLQNTSPKVERENSTDDSDTPELLPEVDENNKLDCVFNINKNKSLLSTKSIVPKECENKILNFDLKEKAVIKTKENEDSTNKKVYQKQIQKILQKKKNNLNSKKTEENDDSKIITKTQETTNTKKRKSIDPKSNQFSPKMTRKRINNNNNNDVYIHLIMMEIKKIVLIQRKKGIVYLRLILIVQIYE